MTRREKQQLATFTLTNTAVFGGLIEHNNWVAGIGAVAHVVAVVAFNRLSR